MVVGPSKTGKSQFAVGMMKRHGIRSPYVVCGGFDLKGFDRTKNGGIVLNDVCGIASYIIKYRELFQANQFDTNLGESATNMYAYSVNTYRIPIIITMNLEEDWETAIANECVKDNCIAVFAPTTVPFLKMLLGLGTKPSRQLLLARTDSIPESASLTWIQQAWQRSGLKSRNIVLTSDRNG